jgi:anti-repressor protein
MSNIQIFNFQDNSQTPVKILIQNNKEYFLAKNVCDILELTNVSQALSRLEKDDIISNDTTDAIGRVQKMSYVSEAGLYELVFASKKPEAKEFKSGSLIKSCQLFVKLGNLKFSKHHK